MMSKAVLRATVIIGCLAATGVVAAGDGKDARRPGGKQAGAAPRAAAGAAQPPAAGAAQPAAPAPARPKAVDEGKRAFLDVYKVLSSPRCRNCHPAGDRPLQGDAGVPHRQNISRRSPEVGLQCTACHRDSNSPTPGAPPGVPNWHMPPRELPMVFEGKSARELCLQLNDPTRTGDRDLHDLAEHMREDKLVLWAWNPGPGRSAPPIAFDVFTARVKQWVEAGGPCPDE